MEAAEITFIREVTILAGAGIMLRKAHSTRSSRHSIMLLADTFEMRNCLLILSLTNAS